LKLQGLEVLHALKRHITYANLALTTSQIPTNDKICLVHIEPKASTLTTASVR
jgi:hypothetical protein